jgi:hypothetical protein
MAVVAPDMVKEHVTQAEVAVDLAEAGVVQHMVEVEGAD